MIMTRFDQRGRSIERGGELALATALKNKGHSVHICCDFNSFPFEAQFGMWEQTDVILGIHGAGLTNAAFCRQGIAVIELKTQYGYTDRA